MFHHSCWFRNPSFAAPVATPQVWHSGSFQKQIFACPLRLSPYNTTFGIPVPSSQFPAWRITQTPTEPSTHRCFDRLNLFLQLLNLPLLLLNFSLMHDSRTLDVCLFFSQFASMLLKLPLSVYDYMSDAGVPFTLL